MIVSITIINNLGEFNGVPYEIPDDMYINLPKLIKDICLDASFFELNTNDGMLLFGSDLMQNSIIKINKIDNV